MTPVVTCCQPGRRAGADGCSPTARSHQRRRPHSQPSRTPRPGTL